MKDRYRRTENYQTLKKQSKTKEIKLKQTNNNKFIPKKNPKLEAIINLKPIATENFYDGCRQTAKNAVIKRRYRQKHVKLQNIYSATERFVHFGKKKKN